jgi:hypothetical protein
MSVRLQIAILRAKQLAKRHFHRAVEVLLAAKLALDVAIAVVARFHAAAVAQS